MQTSINQSTEARVTVSRYRTRRFIVALKRNENQRITKDTRRANRQAKYDG